MVVAHKSNGAIRICVDLINVNKAIVPDRYYLPTIDELAEFFAASCVFSKIDLRWGYLQVKLHEFSPHITSMITPFGLYEWQRLLTTFQPLQRSIELPKDCCQTDQRHSRSEQPPGRYHHLRYNSSRARITSQARIAKP